MGLAHMLSTFTSTFSDSSRHARVFARVTCTDGLFADRSYRCVAGGWKFCGRLAVEKNTVYMIDSDCVSVS